MNLANSLDRPHSSFQLIANQLQIACPIGHRFAVLLRHVHTIPVSQLEIASKFRLLTHGQALTTPMPAQSKPTHNLGGSATALSISWRPIVSCQEQSGPAGVLDEVEPSTETPAMHLALTVDRSLQAPDG